MVTFTVGNFTVVYRDTGNRYIPTGEIKWLQVVQADSTYWYHDLLLLGKQKKKETWSSLDLLSNLVVEEWLSFLHLLVQVFTGPQIQLLLEVRENKSTAGWQYHLQSTHNVQGDDAKRLHLAKSQCVQVWWVGLSATVFIIGSWKGSAVVTSGPF